MFFHENEQFALNYLAIMILLIGIIRVVYVFKSEKQIELAVMSGMKSAVYLFLLFIIAQFLPTYIT